MTEVASLLPANHRLTAVRHFEAGPPPELALVEPGESIALTKEEEWISKKKTEVINTKQIETRVKRQVVLEDGKVVEDSGPMVTTNTTEDTETQEHHQTELRKLGEDETDGKLAVEGISATAVGKKSWVVTPNPDGVVREVKEKRVLSREETEEVKETEDVQHLGDITDENFLAAVRSGHNDIRKVLRTNEGGQAVVSTGPRVVHESSRSKKTIDTEDKRDLSSVQPDGKIITESQRTTEHEEIKDDELPENEVVQDSYKESSERYLKTRDQVDVDYLADGVKIGHEMRFKTENVEVERRGDGLDEPDFDSLSARLRRRAQNRPPHRYRGLENPNASPLDRKDALTGQPLDFDKEEQTRKVETSKWLEHHFGSDSKSSNNSLIDEEEQPPKTSFFNVTIKSQPSRNVEPEYIQKNYSSPIRTSPVVYGPVEPERDGSPRYFKGITEWSERRQENHFSSERRSPFYQDRPSPVERLQQRSPIPDYRDNVENFRGSRDNLIDIRENNRPEYREIYREERIYPTREPNREYRNNLRDNDYREYKEPLKDYNWDYKRENGVIQNGGIRENGRVHREEEYRDTRDNHRIYREGYGSVDRREMRSRSPDITPTPPHRKRGTERRQRTVEEKRYENGYRKSPPVQLNEPLEEPPPDYSPPSPPPMPKEEKKLMQKTRFAADPPKAKSRNIIGQSIRKLVGKIRSASAERKARQRAKRSPSPSYQQGHIIDGNIHGSMENGRPVQRYYLGEDPFAGSIYGRENKYDGVKPARASRRSREDEPRSQSTLGRFSKSTGKLSSTRPDERKSSQTLPRHMSRHNQSPPKLEKSNKSNSTINVSIINTVRPQNDGPAKPARTYKANLSRSKSFNINSEEFNGGRNMYKSNPHLYRLNDNSTGLKSPGLISSLSRSQRDINEESYARFRNGNSDNKRIFLKNLKDRSPELYKTLHESDDSFARSTPKSSKNYNGDIYEPPTRLRDTYAVSSTPIKTIRRESNSSDYSETYRTTTRSDDPLRPSVTNTTKTVSKKTVPSRDGRSFETIESSETKSITKSSYRGDPKIQYRESERRYTPSPVVIEVRNNYRK